MNSKGASKQAMTKGSELQHHVSKKLAKHDPGRIPVRRTVGLSQIPPYPRDMERLFDGFTEDFGLPTMWQWAEPLADFAPQVDIEETPTQILVTAELPGVEKADVEVTVEGDNTLRIRGEKKEESEEKTKRNYRIERFYGSFERTIPLSTPVESGKVEAHMKNGVLTISLPKIESEQTHEHKVEIKAA